MAKKNPPLFEKAGSLTGRLVLWLRRAFASIHHGLACLAHFIAGDLAVAVGVEPIEVFDQPLGTALIRFVIGDGPIPIGIHDLAVCFPVCHPLLMVLAEFGLGHFTVSIEVDCIKEFNESRDVGSLRFFEGDDRVAVAVEPIKGPFGSFLRLG
jgi:hypothetical protein